MEILLKTYRSKQKTLDALDAQRGALGGPEGIYKNYKQSFESLTDEFFKTPALPSFLENIDTSFNSWGLGVGRLKALIRANPARLQDTEKSYDESREDTSNVNKKDKADK